MKRIFLALLIVLLTSQVLCDDYARKREEMVDRQILSRGITDTETIEAMLTVPRHLFVPEDIREEAYRDYALPIGYGQTISQPYIVALMTSSLHLEGTEKALEVGTGSGYQAAVLAEIVDHVYTIEIIPELAQRAEKTLEELGYTNVTVKNADGYFGWEEYQPFDVIMITAAVDHIPPPLIQQLKDGGLLVLPLGNPLYYQALTLVEKEGNELYTKHLSDVQFVPMTGYAEEPEREREKKEEKEEKELLKVSEDDSEQKEWILYIGLLCSFIAILVLVTAWKSSKKDKTA